MQNTSEQFNCIQELCKDLFFKKKKDYGTAWRILRLPSLTDQIFIKAQRIRSIENKGNQLVDDPIASEYIGIINYAIIALIQIELGVCETDHVQLNMPTDELETKYTHYFNLSKALMLNKNHDYGEAWRSMRMSSYTDLILMKLLRIKQIEDNKGVTVISEGIDANYMDIINYSIFAMIKIEFPE